MRHGPRRHDNANETEDEVVELNNIELAGCVWCGWRKNRCRADLFEESRLRQMRKMPLVKGPQFRQQHCAVKRALVLNTIEKTTAHDTKMRMKVHISQTNLHRWPSQNSARSWRPFLNGYALN